MKKLFLVLAASLCLISARAQDNQPSIRMVAELASSSELINILKFQEIDYYRVKFIGADLVGKHFTLTCKTLTDGVVTSLDTIINTKVFTWVGAIDNDTLSLDLLGSKVNGNLKMFFRFPRIGLNKKYPATDSDSYSLRALGSKYCIKLNEPFPAFAYILPYETDGYQMYCAVEQSGTNVEEWGHKFNIKHYLIFEMLFEE